MLIPLKLVVETLVLVIFLPRHYRLHLFLFYRINASLADINISYLPTILCQSQIPYVTLWGSYTTSYCLLALESELLLYFSGISPVRTSTENSVLLLL